MQVNGSKRSYLGHNRAIYTRGFLKHIADMEKGIKCINLSRKFDLRGYIFIINVVDEPT